MTLRDQLAKKAKKGRLRALLIALLFHGLLAVLLFIGIRWKTQTPQPVQIEVFTPPTVSVAQPTDTPAPEVSPPPKPEKIVEPTPTEKPVKTLKPIELPAPDLTIEKQKAEKIKAEKEKAEKQKQEQADRDKNRKESEKLNAEKLKAEKAVAEKATADKLAAEKAKTEKREAKQQERIKQLQQQAGAATGATEGAKTGVTDADYVGRLIAIISRNTVFSAGEVDGNPIASFVVELNPDCSIRSVRLTKSSRAAAWDQAAERAIRRTDPFPKPSGGPCPARMDVTHRPQQ
jgi:colicin import membrane protein